MNEPTETIDTGVVIQITPPHRWAGSFWIIDELHKWGVSAYCTVPGQAGVAYVRLTWEQFAIVGPAPYRMGPTKIVGGEQP